MTMSFFFGKFPQELLFSHGAHTLIRGFLPLGINKNDRKRYERNQYGPIPAMRKFIKVREQINEVEKTDAGSYGCFEISSLKVEYPHHEYASDGHGASNGKAVSGSKFV